MAAGKERERGLPAPAPSSLLQSLSLATTVRHDDGISTLLTDVASSPAKRSPPQAFARYGLDPPKNLSDDSYTMDDDLRDSDHDDGNDDGDHDGDYDDGDHDGDYDGGDHGDVSYNDRPQRIGLGSSQHAEDRKSVV